MSYRRTRAVFIKELHHITRDARSLGLALAVPLLMLVLFGFALSLDVDRIPTYIYDQDRTVASRELVRQFQGSRFFEITGYPSGYREIERAIDRNQILIGIVIPLDYGKRVESGHAAPVQILIDGSDSNTASIALSYAESLVRNYSLSIVKDTQNRVLVYSLKTGEQKGRVFGAYAAVSQSAKLLCVENETGKLAVYDFETIEKRDEFTFSRPISMLRFSQDGRRLFVLTVAQTVYILDVSSIAKK